MTQIHIPTSLQMNDLWAHQSLWGTKAEIMKIAWAGAYYWNENLLIDNNILGRRKFSDMFEHFLGSTKFLDPLCVWTYLGWREFPDMSEHFLGSNAFFTKILYGRRKLARVDEISVSTMCVNIFGLRISRYAWTLFKMFFYENFIRSTKIG